MLNKSTRTITRYVKSNVLHPRRVKSRKGTLEYRFSQSEVESIREMDRAHRPYLYGMAGYPPSYGAAFADYNALAQPPAAPFLVPGMSYPMPGAGYPDPLARYPKNVLPEQKPVPEKFHSLDQETPLQDCKNFLREKKPIKENLPDRASKEIISLLKETTEMLRGQLKTKDDQIKSLDEKIGQLIERNRETNILLKGLQDKIMLLEKPKSKRETDRISGATKKDSANNSFKKAVADADVLESASQEKKDVYSPDDGIASVSSVYEPPTPPAPSVAGKADAEPLPEKKGLFGKIFG